MFAIDLILCNTYAIQYNTMVRGMKKAKNRDFILDIRFSAFSCLFISQQFVSKTVNFDDI